MADIPLQFHEFKHLDHNKRCPKYHSILNKSQNDTIQPNELDELYTDLETLLGAATIRLRQLETEVRVLNEWGDKKDRKGSIERELEFLTQLSNKRSSKPGGSDERPQKKQKVEDHSKTGQLKTKNKSTSKPDSQAEPEVYVSKPKASSDAPNKFWASVEPYCSDITSDDLKVLEDIISVADEDDTFKIPPLGKHYTQTWAQEDLIEEQKEGMKPEKRRGGTSGSVLSSNIENIDIEKELPSVNVANVQVEEETCPFGPFTQRLISALIDENILAPLNESEFSEIAKPSNSLTLQSDTGNVQSPTPSRNFTIPHTKSLENAIKEELFHIGVIESISDEDSEIDMDDEVLMELKRHQSELKALISSNKKKSEKLLSFAKAEMRRQDLRQKAKIIDAEIMDAFRKVAASKQKKKGMTKKEKDAAWKILRDREAVLKLIDTSNR